jgi:hypothetical protein
MFSPVLTNAQDLEKIARDLHTPGQSFMLGIVKANTELGKSVSRSCYLSDSKYLKSNKVHFVSGYVSCKKYGGGEEIFYEILEGDKKFYISENNLVINSEEAEQLKQLEGDEKEAFSSRAVQAAVGARQSDLKNLLDTIKSHRKYGLTVASSSIEDESEYTEGTSFFINVANPTDKTVKYLWFTVVGYNAVGDPVRDHIRNASSITVKGVGPIVKDASGEYSFKYLWHTDLVQTYKISKIKVQYMDGSVKQIDNVKAVTLNASQRDLWDDFGN